MTLDSLQEQLKIVRVNPRRMHESYLRANGLHDAIMALTSGEDFLKFNMRNRIDFILNGCDRVECYCGKLCVPGQTYCSVQCHSASPENRAAVKTRQKENASTRMANNRKSLMAKYGVDHISKVPSVIEKIAATRQTWCDSEREATLTKYGVSAEDGMNVEWCKDKFTKCVSLGDLSEKYFGGMPITTIARHYHRLGIDAVYPKTSSSGERELAAFIESLGLEIERNDRTLCKPKELDIVIPSKKIAIEYDGLYWHSGEPHIAIADYKDSMAKGAGYHIIRVFEDEWLYKQDIVKSILASKLGVYQRKVHARKCEIRKVSQREAKQFLDRCHLQGNAVGVNFGLYYNNELLSIASVVKSRFSKSHSYELLRYATELNVCVVGGFGKLLSHIKKLYPDPILTYCDKRYSTGKTYARFGVYLRETAPGYFWTKSQKRLSRHATQKRKLGALLGEVYDPSKTEVENMEDARWAVIYDRGNLVFEL